MQPVHNKKSAAPVKPRPRPRLTTKAQGTKAISSSVTPRHSYAEVLMTPSPPRVARNADVESLPVASLLELTDSTDEDSKPARSVSGARVRVPSLTAVGRMTTRAKNGIHKKRMFEDAAIFSDQESVSAISPSKKRKESTVRGANVHIPIKKTTAPSWKSPSRKPTTRSNLRHKLPDPPSDFVSSDDTPPHSIVVDAQRHNFHAVTDSSGVSPSKMHHDAEDDLLSISPLKLESAKKQTRAILLPAAKIDDPSVVSDDRSSLTPGFEAWLEKEYKFYKSIADSRRRSTGFGLSQADNRGSPGKTDRSASPLDWSASPPRTTSKGKACQIVDPPSECGDEQAPNVQAAPLREEEMKVSSFTAALANKGVTTQMAVENASKNTASSTKDGKVNSFVAALAKKGVTMEMAIQKASQSITIKQEQYLADINGHRVLSLPTSCEVNSPDSHDILLEEDYNDLPNLVATGTGYVLFSGWASQLPTLDINHTYAAMRFRQHRHFVNMSRISPLDLHTVYTTHDNSKSILYADQRIAICLSPILVIKSHLLNPTDRGLKNKFIKGTLHQQEMQRLVGATCMVFGHGPILHAQIERDSMVFSMLGGYRSSERNTGSSVAAPYIRTSGMFSKSSWISQGSTKAILDVTDQVPIYDARNRDFNYADQLENIDKVLPAFSHEVPAVICGGCLHHVNIHEGRQLAFEH